MKTIPRILGSLFAGLLVCSAASAQSVLSYFTSAPLISVPIWSVTSWTNSPYLPVFDASLGSPTGINLLNLSALLQQANSADADFGFSNTAALSFNQTFMRTDSLGTTTTTVLAQYAATSSSNGAGSFISETSSNFSMTHAFAAIPEPSSYALIIGLAGLGAVLALRRRKKIAV